jgi:hypothetical protein
MSDQFTHILDYVDDYWHDVLSTGEDKYIEEHCQRCPICKVALDEAEKRHTAFQSVPASEGSEQLVQQTLGKVAEVDARQQRRRRILRRAVLPAAAACVAILAIVHIYFLNLAPSPYDLTLLGQAQLFAGSDGSLRVRVLHHERGQGVKDVPVAIDLLDPKTDQVVHLASFNTDDEGTGRPRFKLPDWPDGDYQLRVTARPGGAQTITRTVKLVRAWKLMLTSDRPVYQPGQDIHVRSLALRRLSMVPVAGQEAVFSISDPKGNVIFKEKQVTGKYGICSVDCPLASEILEGTYTIRCQMGDTTSSLAVEVKKYVLPKFKVEVIAERPFYQPGQRVKGKVHAHYFFGKPVAGAKVEISSVATSGLLVAKTNDKGEADFDFLLHTTAGDETRHIELLTTITDSAGQKQSKKTLLAVSFQPLRIELIPEAGTLVAGQPNTIYLYVSTPDGRPAKARLAISGLEKELSTSDLGVASFEFTPKAGEVAWTIRASDQNGQATREFKLTCGEVDNDFLLRTDKAVYSGGDTMHLVALGGGTEPIFVDLIKDGQTMLTETLPMHDGRGEAKIDLPPEVYGTMEVFAYRNTPDGFPVRKTRVLYIRPPGQIKIETTLDKKEYRPGARARLLFALFGMDGKSTPGALSLAAVDEAVFAVLDQATGMEQAYYTLEHDLLRQVLTDWSPVASGGRAGEREQLEQAVFARVANRKKGADREAFLKQLLPFVDNSPRVFEVLKLPDWEEKVRQWNLMPEEAIAILRNNSSFHSLNSSSFPDSVRNTAALKAQALKLFQALWLVLGIVAGIVFFILAIVFLSEKLEQPWPFVIPCSLLLLFLFFLAGPPVQKVREAAARTQANNDLKELALATQSFRDVYKRFPSSKIRSDEPGSVSPRIRSWFPETLLWRPELITDDHGRASLDLDLADSITTWRLTASAVTADGKLGASKTGIKVFQPFFVDINLPVALTRGDEVSVPVVLYNYLDKTQQVELGLEQSGWFTLVGEAEQKMDLGPREVRSTYYRLRVQKVGNHQMQVTAQGSGVADAIKRRIEVVPDGRRVETVWNGVLDQPVGIKLAVPKDAIDGSPHLFVKIYPSTFSQLVEGLDAIFQAPYGCFEQTSSTTYPNVLALDYLRRIKKSAPAIEAKAKQYIHLGYQRLVGFEVKGGGFDWFGNPPANRTLTAYGLMEFEDMAKVHEVDPKLIERTRKWLLEQQKPNGSWAPEGHVPQNLPAGRDGSALARLRTTAYIAWALHRGLQEKVEAKRNAAEPNENRLSVFPAGQFLQSHPPETINDPYTLALVCNALLAIYSGGESWPYLDRLEALKKTSADGKLVWWQQGAQGRTTFHGSGKAGDVETTSLATLALIGSKRNPARVRSALAWLVQQKDSTGAWPSTQATVLALKALLAGTGQTLGEGERRIELVLNNGKKHTLIIPADQAEVMKMIDLSSYLNAGENNLTIRESTQTAAGYQVVFRYHEPGEESKPGQPLSIQVVYDKKKLQIGDTLRVTARIANHMKETAPMVLVELPIPAGFTVSADDFERLLEKGTIAKFQVQPNVVQVYLRKLAGGQTLALPYRLSPHMPVDIQVRPARVYEYYNPQRQGYSGSARLSVVN